MNIATEKYQEFDNILRRLRKECPWDKEQTWQSLRTNTIEEAYELADAIQKSADGNNDNDVKKELGDLFLHVCFYALIAEEQGKFNMRDVIDALCQKLIFRHPHVFGTEKAQTATEVSNKWEELKLKEKDGNKTVLGGVPDALPALIKAYRIQGKAKGVGFDWDNVDGAWDKVKEEIAEFDAEAKQNNCDAMEAEFGDVLFSLINIARHYHINPENALERTNKKFIRRFNYLEEHTIKQGKKLKEMTLEEMDKYWDEAKKLEKSNSKQ